MEQSNKNFVFFLNKVQYTTAQCKDNFLFHNGNHITHCGIDPMSNLCVTLLNDGKSQQIHSGIDRCLLDNEIKYSSTSLQRCLCITKDGGILALDIKYENDTINSEITSSISMDDIHTRIERKGIDTKFWPDQSNLLHYSSNTLHLLIGNQLVELHFQTDTQDFDTIPLAIIEKGSELQANLFFENVLSVHFGDEIYFYSIKGNVLATVHLQKLVEVNDICGLQLSSDLVYMAIILANGQLHIFSLVDYFERFSNDICCVTHCSNNKFKFVSTKRMQRSKSHWLLKCMDMKDVKIPQYLLESNISLPEVNVSGFRAKKKIEDEAVNLQSTFIQLQSFTIVQINAQPSTLYVHLESSDGTMLYHIDVKSGHLQSQSLPARSHLLIQYPAFPPLLMTSTGLCAIAFNSRQEHLVNKLMLFGSARLADGVCRRNAWDECAVPVHALQVALSHRQLDTVAFFFRSRQNLFNPKPEPTSSTVGEALSPSETSQTKSNLQFSELQIQQLQSAVQIIKTYIQVHGGDHASRQFTEQVLAVTLEHLHTLMLAVDRRAARGREQDSLARQVLARLSADVVELRLFVRDLPSNLRSAAAALPASRRDSADVGVSRRRRPHHHRAPTADRWHGLTERQQELLLQWDTQDEQAVITSGVLQCEVPLLTTYLRHRSLSAGAASTSSPAGADAATSSCDDSMSALLSHITRVGLQQAVAALRDGDMVHAQTLIGHLGFDVIQKLRDLCFHTTERALRDYLIHYLQQAGHLSGPEQDVVVFVRRLEALYTQRPVPQQQRHDSAGNTSSGWCEAVLPCSLLGDRSTPPSLPLRPPAGDPAAVETVTVTLAWATQWDPDTRHRVLLEHALYTDGTGFGVAFPEVPVLITWQYLCEHRHLDRLLAWVQTQYPGGQSASSQSVVNGQFSSDQSNGQSALDGQSASGHSVANGQSTLTEASQPTDGHPLNGQPPSGHSMNGQTLSGQSTGSWPYSLPISQEMVDATPRHAAPHVMDRVLDELAKHGVFTTEEQTDPQKLLGRLSRVVRVMVKPHPLDSTTRGTGSEVGPCLGDLHRSVVQLCVDHTLPQLLLHYLTYWGLCGPSSCDLGVVGLAQATVPPWVETMLHLAHAYQDPCHVYQASLAASREVVTAESADVTMVTVEHLLQQGLVGRAMATLMYAPHDTITQLTGAADRRLFHALATMPRLQRALFPPPASSDPAAATSLPPQDVTVYSLLQKNSLVDVSQLFGWQSTNSYTSEDGLRELPHFSHPDLAARYAQQTTLKYTYYLREGRPAYALGMFLSHLVQKGHKMLTPKTLQKVSFEVCHLGLMYYHQPRIAAACVAFLHMLGTDTAPLKLHIEAARCCHDYRMAQATGSCESTRSMSVSSASSVSSLGQDDMTMAPDRPSVMREEAEAATVEYIKWCIIGSMRGKKQAVSDLYSTLTDAVQWAITKYKIKVPSFAASQRWTLVHVFAVHHDLPHPTHFLVQCAHADHWLLFLTHAQVHQVPAQQLRRLVLSFRSKHLQEHLLHVLDAVCSVTSGDKPTDSDTAGQKDVRRNLYTRIGVTAPKHQDDSSSSDSSSAAAASSDDDEDAAAAGTLAPGTPAPEPLLPPHGAEEGITDMLVLVHACLEQPQPHTTLIRAAVRYSNPVLAVIAACVQPSASLPDCLTAWLIAALPGDVDTTDRAGWSEADLTHAAHRLIQAGAVSSLRKALTIFCPDAPILPFLDFYHTQRFSRTSKDLCQEHLDTFNKNMIKLSKSPPPADASCVMTPAWTWDIVVAIVHHVLDSNTGDISHFLETMVAMKTMQGLATHMQPLTVPDLELVYKMHIALSGSRVDVGYSSLSNIDHPSFHAECQNVIRQLLSLKTYTEAYAFASIAKVPADDIVIAELSERERLFFRDGDGNPWACREARESFLATCEDMFVQHQVAPLTAAKYCSGLAERCVGAAAVEKRRLYEVAYTWLSRPTGDSQQQQQQQQLQQQQQQQQQQYELYLHVWLSRIQDHIQHKQDNDWRKKMEPKLINKEDLNLDVIETMLQYKKCDVVLSEEESSALCDLVSELVSEGSIREAAKVTTCFLPTPEDTLSLVLACLRLAHGAVSPSDLPAALRRLLAGTAGGTRGLHRNSTSLVTFPRLGSSMSMATLAEQVTTEADCEEDEDAALVTMTMLLPHAAAAKRVVSLIIALYKAAKVLCVPFGSVLSEPDFDLLQRLLTSGCPAGERRRRYALAKALIQALGLPDAQVAGFLCDAIVDALQQLTSSGPPRPDTESPLVSSSATGRRHLLSESATEPGAYDDLSAAAAHDAQQLIQLCGEPSVLGQRLLDAAHSLNSTNRHATSAKTLAVSVALVVFAHDCHTVACHMEGIAAVLKVTRSLADTLEEAQEWSLMVRLLTGVGRFSEMTYIFEKLKQNHQFEMLFRKGIEREAKLKLAVLDFLSSYHPDDTDAFTMVSLHFTMHREIAHMLRETARRQLAALRGRPLDTTEETQTLLQNILHLYSDAAENFVKENCLHQAADCLKRAKLIGLQLALLSSKVQVINLKRPEIINFVLQCNKFHEAYIVCDAYGEMTVWSEALYTHFVKQGDTKYLSDLRNQIGLPANLITEVADRYKAESTQIQQTCAANMKKLLACCLDLETVYKVAKSLAFTSVVKEMQQSEAGPYLMDIDAIGSV